MKGTVNKYRVATKHPTTGRYNRWRIRWDLPPDPYTGDRRRGIRGGFVTRKAAEAELAKILGQVHNGTYVEPSKQRLAVYLTAWLAGLRLKPTALDNYRTAVEVHTIPRLGGIPLSDLTPEHLDGLYRELERHGKRAGPCRTAGVTCKANACSPEHHEGLAPKSVRHVHTMVRKALQDAAERSLALDPRTVESLRRWQLRQSEERRALPPGVWTDTGLVFTREDGVGHRPKRLSSTFTSAVDRLELPRIGIHGLRHSYATVSLRAGVSPEVVSKRLGHASVVITLSIYAHVFEQDDQAAADLAADAIYGR